MSYMFEKRLTGREQEHQAFRRLAIGHQRSMLANILDRLRQYLDALSLGSLVNWIDGGPILEDYDRVWNPLKPDIYQMHTASGELSIKYLPGDLAAKLHFDPLERRVITSVNSQVAELITSTGLHDREAVRNIIFTARDEGMSSRAAARLIRSSVGMNRVQVNAMFKRRAAWLERGFTEEEINKKWDYWSRVYRNKRADTIAQHEINLALGEGRQSSWLQAAGSGNLDPREWEKVWYRAREDKGCPICDPLNGVRVEMNETFPGGYINPPAHPNCVCTSMLRRK